MAVPSPPPQGKCVLLYVTYLFLEYSCSSLLSSVLQNGSYLHHQSSVLFAFKICFDQIFVGIFFGRFQQKMQLWPGCVFKVYATHFLMWPPLWYNSKLAKSIPLFLNPYPFIQKSPDYYNVFSSWSNLNLWLSQELVLSTNLQNVICMYILLCPGGYFRIFGWVHVCAAGILEPLAYARASLSEFFPPFTRLNLPVYLFSRIQL